MSNRREIETIGQPGRTTPTAGKTANTGRTSAADGVQLSDQDLDTVAGGAVGPCEGKQRRSPT